ncbi:hypothetical protein FIBSPDRAFT_927577 [Athelia psychrophila]|uniref:DUF7702 domain-containing protein n=1 Tax=Athelia psychrophila TaxID=1759441 RepID=A0A166RMS4_9AGAM|nr:hypothetical protein FIBSPDRAFT_927577 [Fibularhizoctonia sp. CBS 109695]
MTTGTLDSFGKIGIAVAVLYIPVLITAIFLVCRHGFKRDAGWIFLVIFSVVRIAGGGAMASAELIRPINKTNYEIALILEGLGLQPLLMTTLGFMRTIGKGSFGDSPMATQMWRVLTILSAAALGLVVYGGINSTSTDPSTLASSTKYRHIGSFLFLALYLLLLALHAFAWMRFSTLMRNRRTLLKAISCAMPFIGIRCAYGLLNSYSGSLLNTTGAPNTSTLHRFNMVTGSWEIYLVMSVLMEACACVIYVVAGTQVPTNEDFVGKADDGYNMYGSGNQNGASRYVAPYRA